MPSMDKPRIAIFRGAFFGVDHQEALEFELHPEVPSVCSPHQQYSTICLLF